MPLCEGEGEIRVVRVHTLGNLELRLVLIGIIYPFELQGNTHTLNRYSMFE